MNTIVPKRSSKKTQVWMDLQAGKTPIGRIVIELFQDVPLAAENFRALCTGEVFDPATGEPLHYAGTSFNMALPGEYVMGGDVVDPNGAGSMSIYGGPFEDEPAGLARLHDAIGLVSMFTTRRHANDSKFMISLRNRMKWLDGQNVVVGKVVQGMKALFRLAEFADEEGKPTCNLFIASCGRLKKAKKGSDKSTEADADEDQNDENNDVESIDNSNLDKPNCEKCGQQTAYVRRVPGKGIRLKCKNNECKHGFWAPDSKTSPEEAAKVLAEREAVRIRRHNALMKHIEIKKKAIEEREERKAREKELPKAEKAPKDKKPSDDSENSTNEKKTKKSKKDKTEKTEGENTDKKETKASKSRAMSDKVEEKPVDLPANALVAGEHLKQGIIDAYSQSKTVHEEVEAARKQKRVNLAIKTKELKKELERAKAVASTSTSAAPAPVDKSKLAYKEKEKFRSEKLAATVAAKPAESRPKRKLPTEAEQTEHSEEKKKEKKRWRELDTDTQKELREKSELLKSTLAAQPEKSEEEIAAKKAKIAFHAEKSKAKSGLTSSDKPKSFSERPAKADRSKPSTRTPSAASSTGAAAVSSPFTDNAIAAKIDSVASSSSNWREMLKKKL